jgi:hypothetical protein
MRPYYSYRNKHGVRTERWVMYGPARYLGNVTSSFFVSRRCYIYDGPSADHAGVKPADLDWETRVIELSAISSVIGGIREQINGEQYGMNSYIVHKVCTETSREECVVKLNIWDIHQRILQLPPTLEKAPVQLTARLQQITDDNAAIIQSQTKIKTIHHYAWPRTRIKIAQTDSPAKKERLEADREYYAARKDDQCWFTTYQVEYTLKLTSFHKLWSHCF